MTEWSHAENDFLERSYGQISPKEIAEKLGRKVHAVHSKACFLRAAGRPIPNLRRPWTSEECDLLRADYRTVPTRTLAHKLKRTVKAVNRQSCVLGLHKFAQFEIKQEIDPVDAAYLAGIVDADGSIYFSLSNAFRTVTPFLSIYNKKQELFHWIQDRFSLPVYLIERHDKQVVPHPVYFQMNISTRKGLKSILRLIFPYLVLKKPQADLILEFLRLHKPYARHTLEELEIALQVYELNAWKAHAKSRKRLRQYIERVKSQATSVGTSSSSAPG